MRDPVPTVNRTSDKTDSPADGIEGTSFGDVISRKNSRFGAVPMHIPNRQYYLSNIRQGAFSIDIIGKMLSDRCTIGVALTLRT